MLEPVFVQAEKNLIEHHRPSFLAGRFEKEVRAVFAHQLSSPIDQVKLLRQSPQIDDGIPYQSLINLYLRDCAAQNRKLDLRWQ